MVKCEVEAGEIQRPSGLPSVEFLGCLEVLQVFVVGPDLNRMLSALEVVLPLFERTDDHEYLEVVYLLVPLYLTEAFG